ncbi:MAG: TIGR02281 family clan AA aspartic protease, partial [Lysobacteraceae bacterium]
MPGLVGVLAFAGLSLSAHAPAPHPHGVIPSARTAQIRAAAVTQHSLDHSPALNRRFSRASDGLFYVVGRVNGVKVRFLLDTGATMVVLTPADAARVGAPRNATSRHSVMETAA